MPEVELAAGTIEYEDTGGDGPVIVMLHGLIMDGSLWRHVVAELRSDYRCVLPTLPLGGHRQPMRADADLSARGIAAIVGELIERLELSEITLAMNDWGGGQLLVGGAQDERIARLVLCSCEAFDNLPPQGTARALPYIARVPGGISAALLHRERTGEALTVDGSLLSQGAWSLGATLAGSAAFGMERSPRYKPSDAPNAMVNSYQTGDGRFVFLVMLQTDRFWPKLVTAFGKPELADDPRFADHAARMKYHKEAAAELAALFAARPYAEAVELLNSTGGAWAPVQRPIDVLSDPQIVANGYIKDLKDANGTPFKLVPAPLQFNGESGTPTRAPGHGEHTDELLTELGLDMDQIIELKISGAVL